MKSKVRRPPPRLAVALAILVHNGRVLIGCRPQGVRLAGFWEFPGGKIEPPESPANCAVREALEETHVAVSAVRTLPVIVHEDPDATVELHPFLCRLNDEGAFPSTSTGSGHFRWVRIEELEQYRFPPANEVLLRWLRQSAERDA